MISEEDKVSRQGVRYWFNILDLDGDGEISSWEIKQFYLDQAERMDELGVECMASGNYNYPNPLQFCLLIRGQ